MVKKVGVNLESYLKNGAHRLQFWSKFGALKPTANTYAHSTSGEYFGRAIKNNVARYKAAIASKVYFNDGHLFKKAITREIDGTLKRLGTDYLDLYIIHRFDYGTPIEETMEVLHNLVKSGQVRVFGAYRLPKIPALLFGKTGIFEVF